MNPELNFHASILSSLPELLALKERLRTESGTGFTSVFMTGSGSTLVCMGADSPPKFLSNKEHEVRVV